MYNNKKIETVNPVQSTLSRDDDAFTALSTSALLAKSSVPYSHRRIADNYVIIKRIYRFQAVQSQITNAEAQLLKKYDFNRLEFSTIKQVNEELSYLKKWSTSSNELLRKDADNLLQIRSKELKYIVASRYSTVTNEIYNGYKALEKYFNLTFLIFVNIISYFSDNRDKLRYYSFSNTGRGKGNFGRILLNLAT